MRTHIGRSIGQYWGSVAEVERAMPTTDDVYVASLEDPYLGIAGGSVCQVGRHQAARLIVNRQFRLATDDEVAQYLAGEHRKKAKAHGEEMARQGRAIVFVSSPEAPQKKGR